MGRLADPDDYGPLLTLSDVAEILGVTIARAQQYARQGTIPAYRPEGARQYYVRKSELLEWLFRNPVHEQPGQPQEPAPEQGSGRG